MVLHTLLPEQHALSHELGHFGEHFAPDICLVKGDDLVELRFGKRIHLYRDQIALEGRPTHVLLEELTPDIFIWCQLGRLLNSRLEHGVNSLSHDLLQIHELEQSLSGSYVGRRVGWRLCRTDTHQGHSQQTQERDSLHKRWPFIRELACA